MRLPGTRLQRAVWFAAGTLFFWWLAGHDLWAPDEPYFAEGAREMIVDGKWAVPHVNGVVTTDKPPLFFWLIALVSLIPGQVTSLMARLPSALAALGTVALTMRMGGRLFGPRTAALAGAVLATSYMFWEKARWSQIDSLLCFLIWIALSAFEAYRAGDADGRRAGLLFWLAAALAVLAKGPVGLLLPLGIVLVVLAVDRNFGSWRGFAPASGPLLFAAVIAAWMVFATVGGQGEYSVWGALKEHFIDRGVHGLHHKQPFWYYLEVLPVQLLPWSGLLPGALVLAWRRRTATDRFLLAIFFFVVLFFSISTEKRELYVLPAFPAIALMMASLVAVVCGWRETAGTAVEGPGVEGPAVTADRRWVTIGQGIVGGLIALVGLAVPFLAARIPEVPYPAVLTLAMIFTAAGGTAVVSALRRRPLAAALAPAAGFAVAYLIVVTVVYPAFEPQKSARPFALRIKEVTADSRAQGLPVVAYQLSNLPEPFAFYSDGVYTVETNDPEVLARHLERPEAVFAVVNGGRLDPLPPALRERLVVVDSTHLARRDVLLVTNAPYPGADPLPAE